MRRWKGIFIVLSCSILLLAVIAQIPVAEQHVAGADLYSRMIDTIQSVHAETMAKVGTSETWDVTINFWNDGSYLYVRFTCPDGTVDAHDSLFLYFDQEDLQYPYDLMHDGSLASGSAGTWEDAKRLGRDPAWDGDLYWDGSDWTWDINVPGHTSDLYDTWQTSGGSTTVTGILPLNGRDTLDLNVKSGAVLGLYILYRDVSGGADYVWPIYGSPPYGEFSELPTRYGDLWTEKVYTAVVPHAHDVPGEWVAFLGVMNTGLEEARVYFQFYDDAGTEVAHASVTVPPRGHFGNHVRNIRGAGFVGSIVITSNEPFSGQLNQHDAAMTQFAIYPFLGEWI